MYPRVALGCSNDQAFDNTASSKSMNRFTACWSAPSGMLFSADVISPWPSVPAIQAILPIPRMGAPPAHRVKIRVAIDLTLLDQAVDFLLYVVRRLVIRDLDFGVADLEFDRIVLAWVSFAQPVRVCASYHVTPKNRREWHLGPLQRLGCGVARRRILIRAIALAVTWMKNRVASNVGFSGHVWNHRKLAGRDLEAKPESRPGPGPGDTDLAFVGPERNLARVMRLVDPRVGIKDRDGFPNRRRIEVVEQDVTVCDIGRLPVGRVGRERPNRRIGRRRRFDPVIQAISLIKTFVLGHVGVQLVKLDRARPDGAKRAFLYQRKLRPFPVAPGRFQTVVNVLDHGSKNIVLGGQQWIRAAPPQDRPGDTPKIARSQT